MPDTKTWAKHYLVNKHFSVIPVGRDKVPLLSWKEFQTVRATEAQIDDWWTLWPDANIGIVTGKISGLTVVDVEAGGKFDFPRTFTVETGGGGRHFYYQFQQGLENKARILELTDIRSEGGYVVAAPSMHKSGKEYKVIDDHALSPFPVELFKGFDKGGQWEGKHHDWLEIMSGTSSGNRNDTATVVCGKLIKLFGMSEDGRRLAWEMLCTWNQKNTPPIGINELKKVFASIHSREDKKGLPVNLLEDFEVVHLSEAAKANDQTGDRYPTGIAVLDENLMGGFKDGDLIVIAGITGHGKTTLAQSITCGLVEFGLPCLWFSYEVFNHYLWQAFTEMGLNTESLTYAPLKNSTGNLDWVRKKIKEGKEKYFIKGVFIDHLGFLEKQGVNQNYNYSAYLSELCRDIKMIAREEEIFIVLMAHVNKTEDPKLINLSHSAGIAQEADVVIMIKRLNAKGKTDEIFSNESIVRVEKARGSKVNKMFKVSMDDRKRLAYDSPFVMEQKEKW
jgi:KaiC/GvpD/RAD55 family RecA-like ATPase